MKTSAFQLGIAAHERGVGIAAHDENLIEWLKQNTSGEAGSAIPHLFFNIGYKNVSRIR